MSLKWFNVQTNSLQNESDKLTKEIFSKNIFYTIFSAYNFIQSDLQLQYKQYMLRALFIGPAVAT